MAASNLVPTNLQNGTIGASMNSTQTSINLGAGSPGFPSLVTSRGDYVPITLINASTLSNSEIVYLTAYTAGNSTGGILRAQETSVGGGSSQTWSASASWEHAPTAAVQKVFVSGGNTTGTLASVQSMYLGGGTNITLSQSGSSVSIVGPSAAAIAFFEPLAGMNPVSTTFAPAYRSYYCQPFYTPAVAGSGRLNRLYSLGGTSASAFPASTATSFASGTTGGASQTFQMVLTQAIYSLGSGTNSSRWESNWSNTYGLSYSQSVGVSLTNASQLTIAETAAIQYPSQVDTAGNYTTASTSQSVGSSFANSSTVTNAITAGITSIYNLITGGVLIPVGFNTTISRGNYLLAQAWGTSQTTAGSSLPVAHTVINAIGFYGVSSYSNRPFGLSAASSGSQYAPGLGVFSAATDAPPTTINPTAIRSFASNVIPYFNIMASSLS